MTVDDRLEKEAQHFLGDVEIGDDAVLERPHGEDAVRCATEHPLRLETDAFDFAGCFFDGDDGGLVQNDPFTADVDERIRGAKIYGDFIRRAPGTHFEIQPAWRHVIVDKGVTAGYSERLKLMKCVTSSKQSHWRPATGGSAGAWTPRAGGGGGAFAAATTQ